MKKLLVFFGGFLITVAAFGQDYGKWNNEPIVLELEVLPKKQPISERFKKLDGTFQIVNNTDQKVLVTSEMLDLVESTRTSQDDKVIDYAEGIELYIPSMATLYSPSFVKLPLEKNNQ